MDNDERGVYRKYRVERVDGSSAPGGKHSECSYFVLDLKHDPFAKDALRAYAAACRLDFPQLAEDLFELADEAEPSVVPGGAMYGQQRASALFAAKLEKG